VQRIGVQQRSRIAEHLAQHVVVDEVAALHAGAQRGRKLEREFGRWRFAGRTGLVGEGDHVLHAAARQAEFDHPVALAPFAGQQRQQLADPGALAVLGVVVVEHRVAPVDIGHGEDGFVPAAEQGVFPIDLLGPAEQRGGCHAGARGPPRERRLPHELIEPPGALAEAVVGGAHGIDGVVFPARIGGLGGVHLPGAAHLRQQWREEGFDALHVGAGRQALQQFDRGLADVAGAVLQLRVEERFVVGADVLGQRAEQCGALLGGKLRQLRGETIARSGGVAAALFGEHRAALFETAFVPTRLRIGLLARADGVAPVVVARSEPEAAFAERRDHGGPQVDRAAAGVECDGQEVVGQAQAGGGHRGESFVLQPQRTARECIGDGRLQCGIVQHGALVGSGNRCIGRREARRHEAGAAADGDGACDAQQLALRFAGLDRLQQSAEFAGHSFGGRYGLAGRADQRGLQQRVPVAHSMTSALRVAVFALGADRRLMRALQPRSRPARCPLRRPKPRR
jgi:hypothetical protein